MDPRRVERLSEALREELSELIEYELEDPRLAGVTVTEARMLPDGRHVHVVVTLRGDAVQREQALEALDHAGNYLRRTVGARLRLFRAPELRFVEGAAPGEPDRIGQLLDRIRKNREKNPGNGP
jgi:ribosome-binding factor A